MRVHPPQNGGIGYACFNQNIAWIAVEGAHWRNEIRQHCRAVAEGGIRAWGVNSLAQRTWKQKVGPMEP